MAHTVSQARQAAVSAVLARSYKWTAAHRKSDNKPFFYVPGSTEGAVYMTAADGCTCPAAQRYAGPCKHSAAVAQHLASKVQAEPAAKPARRTYAELYPLCEVAGCREDALRSGRCLDHRVCVAA